MRVALWHETGAKLREINQTEQIFICSGAKEEKLSREKKRVEREGEQNGRRGLSVARPIANIKCAAMVVRIWAEDWGRASTERDAYKTEVTIDNAAYARCGMQLMLCLPLPETLTHWTSLSVHIITHTHRQTHKHTHTHTRGFPYACVSYGYTIYAWNSQSVSQLVI